MKVTLLSLFFGLNVFFVFQASETLSNDTIQSRLDKGETPKELIISGIPIDSLYGKSFGGGYIFYFFPEDTSGLVVGKKDIGYKDYEISDKLIWGCRNQSVEGTRSEIGFGKENTKKIIEAGCSLYNPDNGTRLQSAAQVCASYNGGGFKDWYLPSKDELHEVYMKLAYTSKIKFRRNNYWTSTERNKEAAWVENLASGYREYDLSGQSYFSKFYAEPTRPIRNFK